MGEKTSESEGVEMIKDIQRNDLLEQLREYNYTDDELQAMDYRQLKSELGLKLLTDDEVKTRKDWF